MSAHLQKPRLTPSTSYSQLGHASDQDAMRSALQSCLEYLDRIDGEILQIRTRFIKLLATCQSEVTVGDSGAMDSTVDLQAIGDDEPQTIAPVSLDELNDISLLPTSLDLSLLPQPLALHSQNSVQEYGPLESVGVTGSLPEGTDHPIGQISQDTNPWLCGAGFVDYELGAQPFLPHHSTYSEGQTLSDSSVRRDQKMLLPNVQGSQDKVTCTWPGCSRVIKKDNRTRHVNETHLRKVKAVCVGCGKGFARSYMKKDHLCRVQRWM